MKTLLLTLIITLFSFTLSTSSVKVINPLFDFGLVKSANITNIDVKNYISHTNTVKVPLFDNSILNKVTFKDKK